MTQAIPQGGTLLETRKKSVRKIDSENLKNLFKEKKIEKEEEEERKRDQLNSNFLFLMEQKCFFRFP